MLGSAPLWSWLPRARRAATAHSPANVARDPVHVHGFQATLLHLLGIEHERVTFKFDGRNFRLTDVHGKVVHGLFARLRWRGPQVAVPVLPIIRRCPGRRVRKDGHRWRQPKIRGGITSIPA